MSKIIEATKAYHAARVAKEEGAEKQAALKEAFDEATKNLIEQMVEEGTPGITLTGLGQFSMSTTSYLSVNAANKPAFLEYLKSVGEGAIIKEDVNSRTLDSFLKGHLENMIKKFFDGDMSWCEPGLPRQALKSTGDTIKSREFALKYLNSKGASYFTERGISFRKDK